MAIKKWLTIVKNSHFLCGPPSPWPFKQYWICHCFPFSKIVSLLDSSIWDGHFTFGSNSLSFGWHVVKSNDQTPWNCKVKLSTQKIQWRDSMSSLSWWLPMRVYCICGKILVMKIDFTIFPYDISLCLCIAFINFDIYVYYLL